MATNPPAVPAHYGQLTMDDIVTKLQASTPRDQIEWLPTAHREIDGRDTYLALAYVDSRFIQNRLDEVVGPFNWQVKPRVELRLLVIGIGIRDPLVPSEWVWKWDTGQDDPELGDRNGLSGGRGIFSRGLKRAGYQWGIARDLYALAKPRVEARTWIDRKQQKRFLGWKESPWGKTESTETGKADAKRYSSGGPISASATTFYDIAYGKLKLERSQAVEIMEAFTNNSGTDWPVAIKELERQMPEADRLFTKQEAAQQ